MEKKILIVEDEEAISQGLSDVLMFHGFDVGIEEDGAVGLEKALNGEYDLVILDIMLPSMDGYTICQKIREVNRSIPF